MTQYQVSTLGPNMPWYIASSFRWNEGCVRKYSPFDAMRRYLLQLCSTHFILFVKIANVYALLMGMSLKKIHV